MTGEYPYYIAPDEDWPRVWGRWRNNANTLMLLGLSRRTAEDIAATWPQQSDDLLTALDPRGKTYRYDTHGAIILSN